MPTEFFHSKRNVRQYIKLADQYDGHDLIEMLVRHLPAGKSVLELGMGPGKDVDILSQHYHVTGSDYSPHFLTYYREKHEQSLAPDPTSSSQKKDAHVELHLLDALTIKIDRIFDCIYSNKVLHQFTKNELSQSLARQHQLLSPRTGIVMHSFWTGNRIEQHRGSYCQFYNEQTILPLFSPFFTIIEIARYREMDKNDSLYVLAKAHGNASG